MAENDKNVTEYINFLKKLPFDSAEFMHIDLSSYSEKIEGVFQKSYFSSMNLYSDKDDNPKLKVIKMGLIGCTVVAMYLPPIIVNTVLKNVTISELKKSACKMVVSTIIADEYWKAEHCVETSNGKMTLLNSPIRLRVQTSKDRNYGKCWDGNSYTLIGNYGDTTDFFIIGALNVLKDL